MKILLSLILLLTLCACSVNPATGKQDFVMMSENQEIAMGKNYHAQVLQQYPLYEDKAIQEYVQKIGDSLSSKSHRPNLFYRFTVLDSPDINAFALPGGYIYINRGLMAYLSSEEELAAVLGHEIGHVTARHSVRQQSQSQLLGILTAAVDMKTGRSAGNLMNLASSALLSGYGRDMELEADDLGAQYLFLDGYSTKGMMDVLTVLKDQEIYSKELSKKRGQEPVNYHGVFASHPSNDKRLQGILEEVSNSGKRGTIKETSDYLRMIDGMVFGDSQKAGVRRGSEFFHGDLDLYLKSPVDWEIVNTPNAIIFRAPFGRALLGVTIDDLNFRETPKEYMSRITKNYYNGEELLINGYDGYTALVQKGIGDIRRLAIVFREKQIYQFVGYMDDSGYEFRDYDQFFLEIIESLDRLDKRGKEFSRSLKLVNYRIKKGDSYEALAKKSSIPYDAEQQLRLLNGDYPDKPLIVGKEIKLVE
jgi:predicted Zn-dependent protease